MQTVMHDILQGLPDMQTALARLAGSEADARGAVFTRREVVEFILDLCGYTPDQDLSRMRLLEPSVGSGEFLIPAIERLLASVPRKRKATPELSNAVRAVEIHSESCKQTQARIKALLFEKGFSNQDASALSSAWLIEGDFLLTELEGSFTHVIGNPPYVRQELIPDALLAAYKERFTTIYDRADLYVPFIERGLELLSAGGVLGYICADRWMKNKYGAPLRQFVSSRFHLSAYVDMVNTDAFNSDVIAYPAITIITRASGRVTQVAHRPEINPNVLAGLVPALRGAAKHPEVRQVKEVANGREPWILQNFDQTALVRRLEAELPTLEEAGCKVGIGVATGADKIFVGKMESLPVEPGRKLPLATTKDILGEEVKWGGNGVVNPFREDGKLVDLEDYPQLKAYFEKHSEALRKRNCAKKNSAGWYRTIDRITPSLLSRPKLLIPDIKGKAHIVYEPGQLYPHHNLYYITSEGWDLQALQAVLLSGIAALFVSTYSVQMAGGFLRFQAQYLRRIRVPFWEAIPKEVQNQLRAIGKSQDRNAACQYVFALYKLTPGEQQALSAFIDVP